ncbi:anaerobic sulfatase maturase [Psittacicella hinzii]|uniref:Anaerobic sulfatase maturase n=1 Tax=Psittacicella hinzii TaxID=2028575 RepID=A0A3A1YP30_9GAMM|nr:anaerobic sulfatase maturase [Psittacicella hinzii]RIY39311.1 anaerobic sulfatase maturase [Psittacicella hinzii]
MQVPVFHLMAKPSSFQCNIKCTYCFYLEKEELFASQQITDLSVASNSLSCDSNQDDAINAVSTVTTDDTITSATTVAPATTVTNSVTNADAIANANTVANIASALHPHMSDQVLEVYIRKYIEQNPASRIDFTWQGGEPTLMGLNFFRKVVSLQQKHRGNKQIHNALQSNGIAFNRAWMQFFKEHNFLIGLSIDGSAAIHDKYRISVNGKPTYGKVKRAIELLQEYQVEFNTLTVVNDANWQHGLETYLTLKNLGVKHMQFIPCVEVANYQPYACGGREPSHSQEGLYQPPVDFKLAPFSVPAHGYGEFLIEVFDYWVKHDVGQIFIREFDNLTGQWLGYPSANCVYRPTCGTSLIVEANGDLYACDHFVYAGYKLGNIAQPNLAQTVVANAEKFGAAKQQTLTSKCQQCQVLALCNGGCPKHRLVTLEGQTYKHNYLCPSYYAFFTHTMPVMNKLRVIIQAGYPAAAIMQYV